LNGTIKVGGRILAHGHTRVPCPTDGYVTSACYSPSLGCSIGLALLERGYERDGETIVVFSGGAIVRCRVCGPNFVDPKNDRLQA
jgi:sarcosine oxidase, subunit alpha